MLKQTLVIGIMGLGLIMSAPTMARSHGAHNDHNYIQPVRHCVSGKQVNKRQANQNRRIQQGKRSGELVPREVKQLRQQQRQIKKAERRMLSDGCLTRDERNRLLKRLNRASNKIYQLKHNNIRRGHFNNRRNHR